jgi:hypothetical protein
VTFGLYFAPNFLDLAVRTNQESASNDAFEGTAHELFHPPSAIGLEHFVGGIAEQREIQFLFGFEILQRFHRVGAGAKNGDPELVELPFCVAKLGRFGGSTGGVGLRKEKDQDTLAFEIF